MKFVPEVISSFFAKRTFSDYFMVIGLIVAVAALFGTDPEAGYIQLVFGADAVAKLSTIPASIFGVAALWLSSKALYDFIDAKALAQKAAEEPTGAALVLLAKAVSQVALAIIIVSLIAYFR